MTGADAGRRRPEIAAFLDALLPCLAESTAASLSDRAFVAAFAAALAAPGVPSARQAGDRPEALAHLDAAVAGLADASPSLRRLGAALAAVVPLLPWSKRSHQGPDAARFAAGHGNALIVGRHGAEERDDIALGLSLMAPRIRYPDHSHPPDELYLVLSGGEWRRGDEDWVEPGIGGTVRNQPGVVHAMRSGERPLLAIWALQMRPIG